jgi:hypothetical protein
MIHAHYSTSHTVLNPSTYPITADLIGFIGYDVAQAGRFNTITSVSKTPSKNDIDVHRRSKAGGPQATSGLRQFVNRPTNLFLKLFLARLQVHLFSYVQRVFKKLLFRLLLYVENATQAMTKNQT